MRGVVERCRKEAWLGACPGESPVGAHRVAHRGETLSDYSALGDERCAAVALHSVGSTITSPEGATPPHETILTPLSCADNGGQGTREYSTTTVDGPFQRSVPTKPRSRRSASLSSNTSSGVARLKIAHTRS